MKKKLLPSFFFIVAFWWLVAYVYWYVNLQTIKDIFKDIWVTGEIPGLNFAIEPITISFKYWITPLLVADLIAVILTFSVLIFIEIRKKNKREYVPKKQDSWRGINVSIGELPKPDWVPELGRYRPKAINKLLDEKLNRNTDKSLFLEVHRKLLTDILFYVWKNSDSAFVGDGHGVSLWEHTLSVMDNAWTKDCDPLIPIAAAAHDAGKILAWYKEPETEEWIMKGYHDDYGLLLVVSMDSFLGLNKEEQEVLKVVIGYSHKENQIYILDDHIAERVENIFAVINKSDRLKTASEKEDVLDKSKTSELLTEAFLQSLLSVPFNTKSSRRGTYSVCYKIKDAILILEPGFRDEFLNHLPKDVSAAFGSGYRKVGNMSTPTVALINHLKKIGWLVETENGMTSECGLWSVRIGQKIFNGVILVTLPKDILAKLPDNTEYDISVQCPLGIKAGEKLTLDNPPNPKEVLEASSIKESVYLLSDEEIKKLGKKANQMSAQTGQEFDLLICEIAKNLLKEKELEKTESTFEVEPVNN